MYSSGIGEKLEGTQRKPDRKCNQSCDEDVLKQPKDELVAARSKDLVCEAILKELRLKMDKMDSSLKGTC